MRKRIAALVGIWALPAWAWLIWNMLSHISNTQLLLVLIGKAGAFIDKHPVFGFIIGFAWLGLLVTWPDLKPHLPAWMAIPKTTSERVGSLETAHATFAKTVGDLSSQVSPIKANIDALLSFQHQTIELLGSLQDSLKHFDQGNEMRDRRIDRIDDSLINHIARTLELETRNKKIVDALGDLPLSNSTNRICRSSTRGGSRS